jgi:NTP pyrophosphatase (non-canonical NTP hydrolase)
VAEPLDDGAGTAGSGGAGAAASAEPGAAPTSLVELKARLRRFADARDWGQFHSPKNLAMALLVEAGELAEHFQWLTQAQSAALAPQQLAAVRAELADVLNYLVRLADVLNVDLLAAAGDKLVLNEQRYPVERVRGSARKYDQY